MRADWNDELRRAYDQGYWDARREFEHFLNRSQMGGGMVPGSRGMERPQQENWTSGGRFEGSYGPENLTRGGSVQASSGGYYGGPGEGYDRSREYDRGGGPGYGPERRDVGSYNSRMDVGEQRYGERRGYDDRSRYDERRGYGEYPPGDRRSAFEHGSSRGFLDRVGDEVRSWFDGDERNEEERRRYSGSYREDRR